MSGPVTVLPSCRHGDVPGCAACIAEALDLVDPACRQCGRGTWLEADGSPALVCDECAAAGWWAAPGESFARYCTTHGADRLRLVLPAAPCPRCAAAEATT